MKTAGIITEYNPLHYGHLALIQAVRQQFGEDTAVICAMSGDFVQRGDFALVRRHARAEAAVRSGADLVLELPLPWAVSSAEGFAQGGVEVLTATGLLDVLAFGSECGDTAALLRTVKALEGNAFQAALRAELTKGDSFAAARQRAVAALLSPSDAALLSDPNNTLGIEYCRALLRVGAAPVLFTIPRTGAAHDAAPENAGGYSASAIRHLLAEGRRADALSRMVPAMRTVYEAEETAGRAPVFAAACERAILARLRSMTPAEFDALDTGHEGVGQRLYNASRNAATLDAVLDNAKTKRYAYARLRRMVLWAYLGLTPAKLPASVPYLRVLAANETGRALLGRMRKTARLPVITKPAAIRSLFPDAQRLFETEPGRRPVRTKAIQADMKPAAPSGGRIRHALTHFLKKEFRQRLLSLILAYACRRCWAAAVLSRSPLPESRRRPLQIQRSTYEMSPNPYRQTVTAEDGTTLMVIDFQIPHYICRPTPTVRSRS